MIKADCKRFIEDFYAFIDGELAESQCAEIQQHLDSCPECLERLQMESRFISWFKKSCPCETAPSALVGSIRSALQKEGD